MTDELKPVCCGCGGEASCYFTHYWGKCFSVQCSECGIEIKPCDTEAEAIAVWNRAMGERTAKVTLLTPDSKGYWSTNGRCQGCGFLLERAHAYCPNCGARLEWK